jgi:hypothetical protein
MWTFDTDAEEGCIWPIVPACDEAGYADAVVAQSKVMAIEILWAASGRQYGQCIDTIRPCRREADYCELNAWELVGSRLSLLDDVSVGYITPCSRCKTTSCGCAAVEAITLPGSPRSIVSVVIDGVTLDPSAYRLDARQLIRTDGGTWPECQDFNVNAGEIGSWEVTYLTGRPVPVGGQIAAGVYSCEILKALCDDDACSLPARVQTVTRQGVTVGFLDPMTFLEDGLTGVYIVDMWIRSVNPYGAKQRARIRRADQKKLGRRVRS